MEGGEWKVETGEEGCGAFETVSQTRWIYGLQHRNTYLFGVLQVDKGHTHGEETADEGPLW